MCNCPNSPWVQNANKFLNTISNNNDGRCDTIKFLINNNHCGINQRTSISEILHYLKGKRINLSREKFQQTVLNDLKQRGIVATLVYPGTNGGVFIPCDEGEVRTVAHQILDRVYSEVVNLEGIAQPTSFKHLFNPLKQQVSQIKGSI